MLWFIDMHGAPLLERVFWNELKRQCIKYVVRLFRWVGRTLVDRVTEWFLLALYAVLLEPFVKGVKIAAWLLLTVSVLTVLFVLLPRIDRKMQHYLPRSI